MWERGMRVLATLRRGGGKVGERGGKEEWRGEQEEGGEA